MLFSSISFLYYFLPTVILIYFIVPKNLKNLVLLLTSLFFYFYGEPIYSILIVISSILGYLQGLWIYKSMDSKYRKIPLIFSILTGIGLLMYFKYTDFFINNLNLIFKTNIPLLNLKLPIGISFYTFQILSYTIDVYSERCKVQKNFFNFATYVSLFPQLVAGPIVRYTTIEYELSNRAHTVPQIAYGIKRFVIGLSKKILLANSLGELYNILINSNNKSILLYWVMSVTFMLQIYYDFSGYSDMAIGLGKMFGFNFLENFNYPYIAKNISEFWRRWHISLSTWFRDYIYIPLGGNRVVKAKWIRNVLVVWLLTGFWHGAQWNFIFWGIYFSIFLILEKYFIKNLLSKLPNFFGHIYTLFFINISFIIFNASSLDFIFKSLKGMFGLLDIPFSNLEVIYYLKSYLVIIILSIVFSMPVAKYFSKFLNRSKIGLFFTQIAEPIILSLLLLCSTSYLIDSSFNPFLYFRF